MRHLAAGAGERLPTLFLCSRSALAVLVSAVLASCGVSREVDGVKNAEVACTSCHGDPNRAGTPLEKSAPPAAPSGGDGGAHRAHIAAGVGCASCHVMPSSPSHSNGVVDVVFSGTAVAGGATPSYSGGTHGTCSGVYCHGTTLNAGGQVPQPVWADAPLSCTSCHGFPPPSPHPASNTCSTCHPETVSANGTIDVAGGHHANGVVDGGGGHAVPYPQSEHGPAANAGLSSCKGCHGQNLDGVGGTGPACTKCHVADWQSNCTFCHGTKTATYTAASLVQAAPPRGTKGETATTSRAVGAHQAHLAGGGTLGPVVACTECHVVPTDLSHLDGSVALTFGPDAKRSGARPAFDGPTATCSSVYCHGATLAGGTNTTPAWTGGTAAASCGTCHGVPPPSPHSAAMTCGDCHDGYTATGVNLALHLNGVIEANGHAAGWGAKDQHGYAANARGLSGCTRCHGADYDGGTSGISCNACHTTNNWSAWQTNCTFCHGARDASYTSAKLTSAAPPVSTQGETATTAAAVGAHQKHLADGTIGKAVACATCHTVPTDLAHVTGTPVVALTGLAAQGGVTASWDGTAGTCTTYCHGASASLTGGTNKAPKWTGGATQAACGTCHGVPPTTGHTASNTSCGGCHTGYSSTSVNLAIHIDGKVDATSPHAAGWAAKTAHGYEVNRTGIGGCASCHGADYGGGTSGISCNACHTTAGFRTWATNCTFCHGTRDASYTSAKLTSAAPPVSTQGESATTVTAVGAHQKHLAGGTIGKAVACATCHTVPTDLAHVTGTPVVALTGLAAQGGVTASWNGAAGTCSTYCHGASASLTGGTNKAPRWTGGATQAACGTCHGIPPTAGHTASNTSCGGCHTGYSSTSVNIAIHIDGKVDATSPHAAGWAAKTAHGYEVNRTGISGCTVCHGADYTGGTSGISCNACHQTAGFPNWATNCTFCHGARSASYTSAQLTSAAPPVGTQGETAPTTAAVGAHQKHLAGGAIGKAVACATCHTVPTDLSHVTGTPVVTLTGLAAQGAAASYSAGTCSTYCHGASLTGGSNKAPSWTGGATQAACGTCHGIPPTTGHTATNKACEGCHTGYTSSTVNATNHLNGKVEATSGHPANWGDRAEHGFKTNKSGLNGCKDCHGPSLEGGTAQACSNCHGAGWDTNCTFCHGTSGGSAAPPVDTQGLSLTTNTSVGLHARHVGTKLMTAPACTACHPARSSSVITDTAHIDGNGIAEVTIAGGGTYTRSSASSGSCSSVWCHGGTGSDSWTATTATACTSCHGTPPATGQHTRGEHNVACSVCHGSGYSSTAVTGTAQATHINRTKNLNATSIGWTNGSCSASASNCHGPGKTETW